MRVGTLAGILTDVGTHHGLSREFLSWFPGVTRAQVDAVLEHAARSAQAA